MIADLGYGSENRGEGYLSPGIISQTSGEWKESTESVAVRSEPGTFDAPQLILWDHR